jgi:hypothetical protein
MLGLPANRKMLLEKIQREQREAAHPANGHLVRLAHQPPRPMAASDLMGVASRAEEGSVGNLAVSIDGVRRVQQERPQV